MIDAKEARQMSVHYGGRFDDLAELKEKERRERSLEWHKKDIERKIELAVHQGKFMVEVLIGEIHDRVMIHQLMRYFQSYGYKVSLLDRGDEEHYGYPYYYLRVKWFKVG